MAGVEIWKDVTCFDWMHRGMYQVSNFGRVKSLEHGRIHYYNEKFIVAWHSEKILKLSINARGYFTVVLSCGGIKNTISVHRLVAMSFIENLENLPTVDHIDRDKTNNNISNLRWATMQTQGFNRDISLNSKNYALGLTPCYKYKSKWLLQWFENGVRKVRRFETEYEAKKFINTVLCTKTLDKLNKPSCRFE
jgi:hypothetical protein